MEGAGRDVGGLARRPSLCAGGRCRDHGARGCSCAATPPPQHHAWGAAHLARDLLPPPRWATRDAPSNASRERKTEPSRTMLTLQPAKRKRVVSDARTQEGEETTHSLRPAAHSRAAFVSTSTAEAKGGSTGFCARCRRRWAASGRARCRGAAAGGAGRRYRGLEEVHTPPPSLSAGPLRGATSRGHFAAPPPPHCPA